MQVNILPPGPPHMMEATVFARPSQEMMNIINARNQEMVYRMQNYYGQAGVEFLNSSDDYYKQYARSTGVEAAEHIALSSQNALNYHTGNIVPLETLEDVQNARGNYLQYLMANPAMTELMIQGRIDAYGDQFINDEGNLVGIQRNAYRAVISGIGESYYNPDFDQENGEEVWRIASNEEADNGMGLKVSEQINTLRAWKIQNQAILDNIDSSSLDGFEIRPE